MELWLHLLSFPVFEVMKKGFARGVLYFSIYVFDKVSLHSSSCLLGHFVFLVKWADVRARERLLAPCRWMHSTLKRIARLNDVASKRRLADEQGSGAKARCRCEGVEDCAQGEIYTSFLKVHRIMLLSLCLNDRVWIVSILVKCVIPGVLVLTRA